MEAEEMKAAEESQVQRSTYLKKSKQRLYKAQKGKRGKYILQAGDSGYDVEKLQQALQGEDVYHGSVDGQYSEELRKAVETFQRQENLTVDGIAGPRTMKALGIY